MKRGRLLCYLLPAALLLGACTEKRYRVPASAPAPDIRIQRYDREFFEKGSIGDSAFWQIYTENIMQAGEAGLPETRAYMEVFRNDSDMLQVWSDCQQQFSDTRKVERQLSAAFKRLCHYVPDMPVPVVGMHLSGFGLSIVSAPDRLSASIDKYLGPDYPYYEDLFYGYQRRRMHPQQLTADYLNGWIRSEFTNESIMARQRLLDYLVYEGKILFLLQLTLPHEPLERLAGWDKTQLDWCRANEQRMWDRILEYEHLYSPDPLVLSKYIGDGPFTVYFTEDSPSRAAIWTGYQMVRQYMAAQPDCSIMDLMMQTDAREILRQSHYRPEKGR